MQKITFKTQIFCEGLLMKQLCIALGISLFLLAGCQTKTGTGALAGGALGATAGGLIGGGEGALIGGAIGAVGGGLVGAALDEQDRKIMQQQSPSTLNKIDTGQQLSVNDIKAMTKAGINENVIISQIDATNSVFYLSSEEIIDLKKSGVSQKVINYMIQTS
jgi:outer membrane lipoprotein SlyB